MARILHIEDDPKSRLLVRKLLSAAGHHVIDAASGLEGVRLADREGPDLVLVDINIPDLDGYEVILRLRGTPALSGVPIVTVTAEGDRQASLALGADGFIGKPIDARRFAKTVARFLRGHAAPADDVVSHHLRQRSHIIVERLERKVRELSDANRRLEELARVRREYLRNVSHELATPMTPVVGYLRLLLDEELGEITPLQRKCLESVHSSTQRLRSVVDSLLDVSSLETGSMHFYARDYDFAEVAARAVADVRQTFVDAGVELWEAGGSESLPALGDPEKIRRAMVHVLENAAKFTPAGGEAGVGVRSGGHGHERWCALMVADSGPGIEDGLLERILEPFFQADGSVTRSHGGVGLGLAFARHVAEAMDGGVDVQSPPGSLVAGRRFSGTCVRLWVGRRPRPCPGSGEVGAPR